MRPIAWALLCGAFAGCSPDAALQRLGEAEALHRSAAEHAARAEVDAAVRDLEEVAALRFPAAAPEAEDVAVDALAEASRVLLEASRAAEAEAMARRAVERATRSSYFQGLAYLRLGDALRALGRPHDAVAAFERSIEVNRAVLAGGAP
jgi:tetratricopeptide (TPR) repeat protein